MNFRQPFWIVARVCLKNLEWHDSKVPILLNLLKNSLPRGDCLPLLPFGVILPDPIGGRGGVLENWDSFGMRTPLPETMGDDGGTGESCPRLPVG